MSSKPPRKTDHYHHGNLRTALLGEARALLEEGGASALSLRAIARRLGVAAPSAYHHFNSLEAIALALAETGFSELAERLENAQLKDRGQLAGTGHAYVRFAVDNPALYRLMFGDGFKLASSESEALRVLRRRSYEPVKTGLRKRLPEDQIGSGALFLWSLVHGLALLLIDKQIDDDADIDVMITDILRMSATGFSLPK